MTKSQLKKITSELCRQGLSRAEANIIVAEYVEADRVGQKSHGTAFLPNFFKRLKQRGGPIKLLKDSGPTVYIDGQRELGQLAAEKAIALLIKKARRYGIGIIGLRNILPFMRPGTYVRKLAVKNFFGLGMIGGGTPMVTHPDSPERVIGTNPIAFGFPTTRGPLVVDMATSKKAWAEVRYCLLHHKKLPGKTYKDQSGGFTRDPKMAFSVIPFGDYKGFALGMMVEILCGSFLGMKMSKHKKAKNNVARSRSAVFIAVDPSRFVSLSKFKRDTTQFLKGIKASKRNSGIRTLRIPGEASIRL